jgi:hemerythrin-like domain-containing protein
MTAPMTMNRVIHAAVRRDLDRLAGAVQSFDAGDHTRARDLERAYANLHRELTRHHEGEDAYIFPMLGSVGVSPELLETMESEHSAMAEALADTDRAMTALAESASAADAATAHASVVRTREVVDRHLDHEETELEPQMTPYLETPEWQAVEKKLRKAPPGVIGRFFAWLTDGMGDEQRAYLRSTIPPPVVAVLIRVFGRRYTREVAPVWKAGRGAART